ncbi:MAG: SDR family NAD(P)-dependent oxidoreductase [Pseudomonadota bacterium]
MARTLHGLFRRQAARRGDALAIDGMDRRLTFAQLDNLSDRLAARLSTDGAGRGALVALHLEPSADFVVGMLATLKAGAAFLPLERALPPAALSAAREALQPSAVLARPGDRGHLGEGPGAILELSPDWPALLTDEGAPTPTPEVRHDVGPDDPAYAVLSSGTTGAPKAILAPHRGAIASYWGRYRLVPYAGASVPEQEREGAHIFFMWEALRPLLAGRSLTPIPGDVIFDPKRLVAFLERRRLTRVLLTPSLLEQVLAAHERGALGDTAARLRALRVIILNGEPVASGAPARMRAALPHVRLINDYSISECHGVAQTELTHGPTARRSPEQGPRAPVGRAMEGVSIHILDPAGAPVPWGARGEIHVGGRNLAIGYLGADEETAARFQDAPEALADPRGLNETAPDGSAPSDGGRPRLFRTGDLGRFRGDGALEVEGRAHFLIKLRGHSIAPEAVEAALTAYPGVASAALAPAVDPETGATVAAIAFYAPVSGAGTPPPAAAALRAHLRDRLPGYAVPARLIAVTPWPLDAATGKLDRRALPDPWTSFRDPKPSRASRREAQAVKEDAAAVEDCAAALAEIWRETLGVRPEGGDADFFDLGGHSLAAVEVAAAIEAQFGAPVHVADIFDHPTLGALAEHVRAATGSAHGVAAPRVGSRRDAIRARSAGDDGAVAVLSLAGRFPGAETEAGDLSAFWSLLMAGGSGLTRHGGANDAAGRRVPVTGRLSDIEQFDHRLFGLSRREAQLIDPQHRIFLENCWRALEFAGYAPRGAEAELERLGRIGGVGVFGGCWLPLYLLHHLGGAAALSPDDPTGFHLVETGNDKDYLTARVAYLLNLTGPALSVQTSCSTGLVAVAEALQALRQGRCAMALAGAASLNLPRRDGYIAEPGHVGSPSGACRSFDAQADGVVFTDGVAVTALKRLSDAQADGDPILAVIRGVAVSGDGGERAGFSAPSARGQERTLRAALADAGLEPGQIDAVEAHGTGTRLGDPIEMAALNRAYGGGEARAAAPRPDGERTLLGSAKSNIGHANIAAGMAGFAKAALSLHHGAAPPTIGVAAPNPKLDLERSPFRLHTGAAGWPERERAGEAPRRMGVSSFGVGGVNCHMILEEAPRQASEGSGEREREGAALSHPSPNQEPEILLLSARSASGLDAATEALAQAIDAGAADANGIHNGAQQLSALAETLRVGRDAQPRRRAVAVSSIETAPAQLRARLGAPDQVGPDRAGRPPRVAWLFPGHGAQHGLMGAGLMRGAPPFAESFERDRALFEQAAREAGAEPLDLADLHVPGRAEALLASPLALQAAIYATQRAVCATLTAAGLRPAAVLGHSLGEYAAAVAAGALQDEAAVALVTARALAAADAPPGAMVAVLGPEGAVRALLEDHPDIAIAGHNAPDAFTLAGPPPAVERVTEAARGQGLHPRALAAPRAFHTAHMDAAAAALNHAAAALEPNAQRAPQIPFASTLTGGWAAPGAPLGATYWGRQMRAPVRFAEAAMEVLSGGVDAVLEIGPGRGLGKVMVQNRQLDGGAQAAPVLALAAMTRPMQHPRSADEDDLHALHQALAALWERGADITWTGFRTPRTRRRTAAPGAPFERERCWIDERVRESAPEAGSQSVDRDRAPMSAARRSEIASAITPPAERFYLPSFGRAAPAEQAAPGALSWSVMVDAGGASPTAAAVLARLRRAGDAVRTLPADPAEAAAAYAAMESAAPGGRLLWLRDIGATDALGPATALIHFGAALAERRLGADLTLYSQGALAVGGEHLRPDAGALLGALLAIGQETPRLAVRALDVDGEAATEASAVRELRAKRPRRAPFVAARGPHLWVEGVEPYAPAVVASGARPSDAEPAFDRRAIAVTGGFGRIGLALAERWLSKGARVTLSGRRPERAADAVDRLRRAYPDRLHTLQLDIAEHAAAPRRAGAVALITEAEQRWGRLDGVFHAAGLADLKYVGETTEESLAAEYHAKITGTRALADAIARMARPPDFVALFSSLAAPLGGLGMAGYGGANRFLDLFAEAQTRGGAPTRWLSIAWDDWAFDYTREQTAAWERTRADLALPPAEALDALETLLAAEGPPCALVSATPLAPRRRRWLEEAPSRTGADQLDPEPSAHAPPAKARLDTPPRPGLAAMAGDAPTAGVNSLGSEPGSEPGAEAGSEATSGAGSGGDWLSAALDAFRGILAEPAAGPDSDFFDLGGDSLLATQVATRLAETMARRAAGPGTAVDREARAQPSIADVLDNPTPRSLADALQRRERASAG